MQGPSDAGTMQRPSDQEAADQFLTQMQGPSDQEAPFVYAPFMYAEAPTSQWSALNLICNDFLTFI